MKKRVIGRTGVEVTELTFGAWGIGSKHYGPVVEKDAREAMEAYIAGGGNFIDTARGYNLSEQIIGRYLKDTKQRDKLILGSKIWQTDPAAIRTDFDESCRQLQTDMIDVLFIHNPPDSVDEMNRVLDVFGELKAKGRIRAIGASVKGANVSQATVDLCRQYIRSGRTDILMVIFSILRQKTRDVFDEAAAAGVGIMPRTVMENGFLTGKYKPGHTFPAGFPNGDHRSRWNGPKLDKILLTGAEIEKIAVKPPYRDLAQVAVRFALDENITTVTVGAKSAAQSKAALEAAALPPLPAAVRQQLTSGFSNMEQIVNLE